MQNLHEHNAMMDKKNQIIIGDKTVDVFMDIDDTLKEKIVDASKKLLDEEYVRENSGEEKVDVVDGKFIIKKPKTVFIFDSVRTFYMLQENKDFLVMYNNHESRDRDIILHQKNTVNSPSVQSPDVVWSFDSNGKYFLVLSAKRPLRGRTDKRKYGWMIINPNIQSDIINDYSEDISDTLNKQ